MFHSCTKLLQLSCINFIKPASETVINWMIPYYLVGKWEGESLFLCSNLVSPITATKGNKVLLNTPMLGNKDETRS